MSGLFLLLPAALPLTEVSTVSLADVERLRSEYGRTRSGKEQPWHSVSSRVRAGESLYWGFAALVDILACVRWGADPRVPAAGALEVVHVNADKLLADDRFVRPAAASLASEVPSLRPASQHRPVYAAPQWIFAPTDGDLTHAAATVRLPPEQIVQRAVAGAVRATTSRAQRQRLLRMPTDPRALTADHLDELASLLTSGEALLGT